MKRYDEHDAELELKRIAGALAARGFDVAFGYAGESVNAVFYNDASTHPTHSLTFEPCSDSGSGWILVGGFIAYPIEERDGSAFANLDSARHLNGGEAQRYDFENPDDEFLFGFEKDHYADGFLANVFVPGGFGNPLVRRAMEEECDALELR